MPLPTAYSDGTATITNGSASVVGQGTSWLDMYPGDVLWSPVDGIDCRIATIEDDTHLTLVAPWPGTTITTDPYEIRVTPDTARMQEQTRLMLDQLSVLDSNSQGLFYTYDGTSTADSDPGLGKIRWNNASAESATEIYIDDYDSNRPNRLVTGLIGVWAGGTSLIIRSLTSTAYVAFKLTAPLSDSTGYQKAASAAYIGGDGAISSGEAVSISWFGVGAGLQLDAVGTFAGRAAFNASAEGFVYLSTNGDGTTTVATLYRKNSATSGDWSAGAAIQGAPGFKGWSPRHAIVSDGARRVWQLLGYIGGEGVTPTAGVGQYVATTGYTAVIADAIDVRGTTGLQGDSAYTVAVANGFVGSAAAWLASLNGTNGVNGTDPGVLLIWSTSTTDANPGAGVIRANQATITAATQLFVSKTNRPGNDISAFLANLASSTNPTRKGTITLTRTGGNAQTVFDITALTDATGYVKLTVTNGSGATGFTASDLVSLQFSAAGDRGSSGPGTGTFNGPPTSVDGNLIGFDGTDGEVGYDTGIAPADIALKANNLTDLANLNTANDNLSINGADIASAATVNLETATGSFVEVTGTTTTTAITLANGHRRRTRAAAAWPITVGASLTLNNAGASYTCAAGDIIDWVADGAVVRGTVIRADGKALVASGGDVVGPASATANRIAVFDGATGKLVKDGGKAITDLVTSVNGQVGALLLSIPPLGRPTLTSGAPVMAASVAAAATVYYTPYAGNIIPIYDGTNMIPTAFSELSQATTDTTKSPAAVAANKVYDLFVWNDAGTLRCTRGPAWTNDTTPGYTLTAVNGIKLNTSSITNGPAALRGTRVGTIMSNGTSTIDFNFGGSGSGGVAASFGVWSAYNRVAVTSRTIDSGAGYTFSSGTVRQARASAGNQIKYVQGDIEDGVSCGYAASIQALASAGGNIGIGFNSIAYYGPRQVFLSPSGSGMYLALSLPLTVPPSLGVNTIYALEQGDGVNANTFNVTASATLSATVML